MWPTPSEPGEGWPRPRLARPDILAAEHRLRAANADIGAARAAFFTHISLTSAVGTPSPDVWHLFASGTDSWRYAPVAQTPIFAGGGLKANLEAAGAERGPIVGPRFSMPGMSTICYGTSMSWRRARPPAHGQVLGPGPRSAAGYRRSLPGPRGRVG